MAAEQKATLERPAQARRMQLRYGFNEVDGWWHISLGPNSEQIRRRLRLLQLLHTKFLLPCFSSCFNCRY